MNVAKLILWETLPQFANFLRIVMQWLVTGKKNRNRPVIYIYIFFMRFKKNLFKLTIL